MTNTEAIETLRANYPDACYEQLREAVDVAIEALKAQVVAGDTISRQAALEIMTKWLNDVCGMREIEGVKLTPLKQLRELPSVKRN